MEYALRFIFYTLFAIHMPFVRFSQLITSNPSANHRLNLNRFYLMSECFNMILFIKSSLQIIPLRVRVWECVCGFTALSLIRGHLLSNLVSCVMRVSFCLSSFGFSFSHLECHVLYGMLSYISSYGLIFSPFFSLSLSLSVLICVLKDTMEIIVAVEMD